MALSINPTVSGSLTKWKLDAASFGAGAAVGAVAAYLVVRGIFQALALVLPLSGRVSVATVAIVLAVAREARAPVWLPYRRRQVPEGLRAWPTTVFSFVYGAMLGFGFVSPFTCSTHLAMLTGLALVTHSGLVALTLSMFALGKSLVLLETISRNASPEAPIVSNTSRIAIFVLHLTTVGMSIVVLTALWTSLAPGAALRAGP